MDTNEAALREYELGIVSYLEASHPGLMSDWIPDAVKDRAARLRRAFPGTRQYEWLHALSKAMGFSGWNNLIDECRNLKKLLSQGRGRDPNNPIPPIFSKTLILLVRPAQEIRPSFIDKLEFFTNELAVYSHQPVEELRLNMAPWWGAYSWEELSTRYPRVTNKAFYRFEAGIQAQWHMSDACQQAIGELMTVVKQLRNAGEDEAPLLRRVFQGYIQEQPLFAAGLALAELLRQRGQNAESLKVLTALDEMTAAKMPADFSGELHGNLNENNWYLQMRYRLLCAHLANENLPAATEVCRHNVILNSRSGRWCNVSWLMTLLLAQRDVSAALRARRDFVFFQSDGKGVGVEFELAYIVALLAHDDYIPASIYFARCCFANSRAVEYFLACIEEDDPELLENSNEASASILRSVD